MNLILNTCLSRSVLALTVLIGVAACGTKQPATEHSDDHAQASAEHERGPHRGRMLRDSSFALELQIFESGVSPEFHVYLFENGMPLPPQEAQVEVQLIRLGNKIDRFEFAPSGDYLLGAGIVTEPHSFAVVVTAKRDGEEHRWAFDSFEGRTSIDAAIAEDAGIAMAKAGPATIIDSVTLTGRVVPNPERVKKVSARYPGVIRSISKSMGDQVTAGDVLATVESNDSLRVFELKAPMDGILIERHANSGELTGTEPLFVVADYRELWVELSVFPRDIGRVKSGQSVKIVGVDSALSAQAKIAQVLPIQGTAHGAGTSLHQARLVLDNPELRWSPGLFVNGQVAVASTPVPLAVQRSGLQAFRDFTVVYERIDDTYEVRMLELGRQDDTWAEVLGGIESGASYVSGNSYLIKADIGKSGASHDH